jgi:5-methylcytosine-specific restriction endonuclease McrA
VKAERRAEYVGHLSGVREAVVARDRGRCRICEAKLYTVGEMHEVEPRSKTRGLPNPLRFSTANCLMLCHKCHQAVTEHRLTIKVGPAGADGPLAIFGRDGGLILTAR